MKFLSNRDLGTTVLGEDPIKAYVDKIASITHKFSREQQRKLLHKVKYNLLKSDLRRKTIDRIVGSKIIVALLPDSLDSIRELLTTRTDRWSYEVHFTLFCYLEDCQYLPVPKSTKREVLKMIFDYLISARVRTARAAWMAGHLLGDHWEGREALSCLREAAVKGIYAEGRKGALTGLNYRLKSESGEETALILNTIQKVSVRDPSRKLRTLAGLILEESQTE